MTRNKFLHKTLMSSNLFIFMILMSCLADEKVLYSSKQGHFPLKDCIEENTVVLSLLDYDLDETWLQQLYLITLLFKDLINFSSQWTRVTVVDQLSAHSAKMNVSDWIFDEINGYPTIMRDTQTLEVPITDLKRRLETKVHVVARLFAQMNITVNNAVHVGIVFLNGQNLTQEEIRNVPSVVQQRSVDVKIFTVIFGCKLIEEIVHMTDTIVLPDMDMFGFHQHLLMAMCKMCVNNGFPFEHKTGLSMLSCFITLDNTTDITRNQAMSLCQLELNGYLPVLETKEEVLYLKEFLPNILKSSGLSQGQFHIGLRKDLSTYAKQFQWLDHLGRYRPQIVNHWLPGQPCRECMDNDCVVWQFTGDWTYGDDNSSEIQNTVSDNEMRNEGWTNINCHSRAETLCEVVLPRKITDLDFILTVPVSTNSTDFVKEKERFLIYQTNIVSLSANVPDPKFLLFFKDSKIDFPIFDCGEDAGDRRYISYNMVCDFVDHCSNRRDETLCVNPRQIFDSETYCKSGQKLVSKDYVCDNVKHCKDGSDEENCFHKDCKSVRCQDGSCLPLHWVNDGVFDCFIYLTSSSECMASDESFHGQIYLLNNKSCALSCDRDTCIDESQLNDSFIDCKGPESAFTKTLGKLEPANTCRNKFGHFIWAPKCHYIKDRYGGVIGCRDMSHLRDCENFQCGQGFVKCYNSYCISHYYLRDGRADCPTGEDEQLFYTSPFTGYFACWDSNIFRHPDLVCDGHPDCPHADDELDCSNVCPNGFRCIAGVMIMSGDSGSVSLYSDSFFIIDPRTRYMDLSGVEIKDIHSLIDNSFDVSLNLKVLILSNCNISELPIYPYNFYSIKFRSFVIEKLDISYNRFEIFSTPDYSFDYQHLRYLNMSYNRLLKSLTNIQFSFLEVLDISYTSLANLNDSVFAKLPRLKHLNLSHTLISVFTRQYFSPKQILHTLDLRGILTQDLDDYLFHNLTISQALYTDHFQICCPQIQGLIILPHACIAPVEVDAISSCSNLLGLDIQRFLLWIVAIIAVLGNLAVIVYRVIWDRSVLQTGYGLFVTNLGISDFIMGVYLFIIAGADYFYRDSYVFYDKSWRNSAVCKIACFMACLSCEASTFFVFLITLDRFLVMKFPFGQVKFTGIHKIIALVMSWMTSFLLSLLPALLNFDIYSSNAMCLGLPLTNSQARGWEYSVAVFIIFNLIMFVFIACGQYAIFHAMSENRISKTETRMPSSRRAEDITVAKQLSLVVLSNFLFWFPVGIMGLMSLGGHEVSSQVYAWTTVFLLPINSAANPVLYTIPALLEKWEQFKRGNQNTLLGSV